MRIVQRPGSRARGGLAHTRASAHALFWLLLFLRALPLSAQLVVGADVTLASQSIRHGLPRVTAAVLQPSAYVALRAGPGFATVGVWAEHELGGTEAGDRSLVGVGQSGIGAVEGWVEYAARADVLDWRIGYVHMRYRNDEPAGGISADLSTGEIYAEVRSRHLPVTIALTGVRDVDALDGQYFELDVVYPLATNPLGTVVGSIFVGGRAGLSHGLDRDDDDTSAPWYFDDDGFTHAELYAELGVDVPVKWLPIDVFLSAHHTFAIDDAVRRESRDPTSSTRSRFWWFEVAASTSVSFGSRH